MKRFICIIILVLVTIFLYASYINVKGYKIYEYEIASNKITEGFDGFKIVHFSDLLYEKNEDIEEIKLIIDNLNRQNANIVVFTGDVVKSNISLEKLNEIGTLFKSINADYKYAIIGDHDNEDIKTMLKNNGFEVLENNYVYVYNKDISPIKIMDLNNFNVDILNNEDEISPSFVIGLLHKPDEFKKIKEYNIDVVFAGHSLGGQIRLPFWGALIKKDGAKIYTNNYYKENDTMMYVCYGVGVEKTPFRTLNKPSFNVYRLKSL